MPKHRAKSGAGRADPVQRGHGFPPGFHDWTFAQQERWLEAWLHDIWTARAAEEKQRRQMADFRTAIETVIATHEGGFQNRADDPGNWTPSGELKGTKFGISAHSFPDLDIEDLTLNDAEDIYRKHWGGFAAIADQAVATKVLDLAVDMEFGDHGPATTILQKAIVACGIPVKVDGVLGPKTITACNNLPAEQLKPALIAAAVAHYQAIEAARPGQKGWFNNWDSRAKWWPAA